MLLLQHIKSHAFLVGKETWLNCAHSGLNTRGHKCPKHLCVLGSSTCACAHGRRPFIFFQFHISLVNLLFCISRHLCILRVQRCLERVWEHHGGMSVVVSPTAVRRASRYLKGSGQCLKIEMEHQGLAYGIYWAALAE